MSLTPIYLGKECYSLDLRNVDLKELRKAKAINLSWLIETNNNYPDKNIFCDNKQSKEIVVFEKLAGGPLLQQQIVSGLSEQEIRESWAPGLANFHRIRSKYLLSHKVDVFHIAYRNLIYRFSSPSKSPL